jgi:hypothetical protein
MANGVITPSERALVNGVVVSLPSRSTGEMPDTGFRLLQHSQIAAQSKPRATTPPAIPPPIAAPGIDWLLAELLDGGREEAMLREVLTSDVGVADGEICCGQ